MQDAQKKFKESQLSDYYDSIDEMLEDRYVDDKIREIADENVDIYYSDIYKSLPDMVDYIEEAREQGLIEGSESIDKQIQIGQYLYYLEQITEEYQEIVDSYEEED